MDGVFTQCDSRAPLVGVRCIRLKGHEGAHRDRDTGHLIEWNDREPNTPIMGGADE